MSPISARRVPIPILLALLVTLLVAPSAAASTASTSGASTSSSLVNQERADRGIARLTVSSELNRIATDWSQQMAKEGRLYHNPDLASQTGPAAWRAENVGMHPAPVDVDAAVRRIHDKFMSSSGHRANILETRVHEIGVGVVQDDDGNVWITQVFRSRSDSGGTSDEPKSSEPSEPKPPESAPAEEAPSSAPEPAPQPADATPAEGSTPADEGSAHDVVEEETAPDPAPTHRAMTAPRLSPDQLKELKTVRAASGSVEESHVLSAQSGHLTEEHPLLVALSLLGLAVTSTGTLAAARRR